MTDFSFLPLNRIFKQTSFRFLFLVSWNAEILVCGEHTAESWLNKKHVNHPHVETYSR